MISTIIKNPVNSSDIKKKNKMYYNQVLFPWKLCALCTQNIFKYMISTIIKNPVNSK